MIKAPAVPIPSRGGGKNRRPGKVPCILLWTGGLALLTALAGLGIFPAYSPAEPPIAIITVSEQPPKEAPAQPVKESKDQEAPPPRKFQKEFPPGQPVSLPEKTAIPLREIVTKTENLAQKGPVIPPPEREEAIDLETTLRLAERINPNIAIGRTAIQVALAQQVKAKALVLPHLRVGANYHAHLGVLQTSFGLIRHVDEQSLYFGAGSRTLAAETVAFPGVQFLTPLGDALFERLSARQEVAASQARAGAIANTILLEAALRFLDLMMAEAELSALKLSEWEMNQIVQTTQSYFETGRGRESNAHRARTEALLLHIQEQTAEERLAVAAAELARVLHLDPSVRLRTPARTITPLQLVDPQYALEQLLELAQAGRPELAALRAEIARRQIQIRQERLRPLFPTLSVGYSAGGFGGSTSRQDLVPVNPGFHIPGARTDFDVVAFWTLQNMGAGNIALTRQRQAERQIAIAEQVRMLNQVRKEVTTALALTEVRRQELNLAYERLKLAERALPEDNDRIRNVVEEALPIELLDTMDRLVRARLVYIDALAAFNQAQFQLFTSLGQNPLAAGIQDGRTAEK